MISLMFNPAHLLYRSRCANCGMTIEEIVKYDLLLCPAGAGKTLRSDLARNGFNEVTVMDIGYDVRKHGPPYSRRWTCGGQ